MKKKIIDNQIRRTKSELERELEGIIGKELFKSWKEFAFKKSMLEMAIAFVLGASFQKVVTGLSNHCLMPVLNWMLEFTGEDWRNQTYQVTEGLKLEIGKLAGAFVDFLLISIILFFIYRRIISVFNANKQDKQKVITCIDTKSCHLCQADIHYLARRCPYCTSWTAK